MAAKVKTTSWSEIRARRPNPAASEAAADEARITAFRELVYQLRHDAGLTQAELADRMGTTQSAIARMEGGGTRPTSSWPSDRASRAKHSWRATWTSWSSPKHSGGCPSWSGLTAC